MTETQQAEAWAAAAEAAEIATVKMADFWKARTRTTGEFRTAGEFRTMLETMREQAEQAGEAMGRAITATEIAAAASGKSSTARIAAAKAAGAARTAATAWTAMAALLDALTAEDHFWGDAARAAEKAAAIARALAEDTTDWAGPDGLTLERCQACGAWTAGHYCSDCTARGKHDRQTEGGANMGRGVGSMGSGERITETGASIDDGGRAGMDDGGDRMGGGMTDNKDQRALSNAEQDEPAGALMKERSKEAPASIAFRSYAG